MKDWQQRVIAEELELSLKMAKLSEFLDTCTYAELSLLGQAMLMTQAYFMSGYRDVLTARIDSFDTCTHRWITPKDTDRVQWGSYKICGICNEIKGFDPVVESPATT